MRIGLIAPPWVPVPPPRYGGTEVIVDVLARGFAALGHDVTLFATGDSACPVRRRWVHRHPPDPMNTTIAELRHVQAAYAQLADCDIIHDHTVAGPFWAATRRDRPPVVATIHGEFTAEMRSLYREAASWAWVTAISRSQRATAPDVAVAAVIHHGLDASTFPSGAGDGGYAAFLGRLAPQKGAHLAIEIARRAGIRLRIAAKMREPAEHDYFKHQIEPELGPDVEYLGEIGPGERKQLLRGAAALVNPISWAEPFGLVMIEAMACGTPVIAYPHGAAPEIVSHGVTGFLCADTREATAALVRIGDLSRAACRSAVQAEFSADRMVRDYLAVFRHAMNGATTPHHRRVPASIDGHRRRTRSAEAAPDLTGGGSLAS